MTFEFNGLNLMPYLADDGLDFRRADVEGRAKGTAINGAPIRDKRGEMYEWTLKCIPLTAPQLAAVLTAIHPKTASCTCTDPKTNANITVNDAFAETANIRFKRELKDGVEHFNGLTFPVYVYLPNE